jgi:hypothetical protein
VEQVLRRRSAAFTQLFARAIGWKTGEIGVRQGANRSQVEHLARIRNAASRRFSPGFRHELAGQDANCLVD